MNTRAPMRVCAALSCVALCSAPLTALGQGAGDGEVLDKEVVSSGKVETRAKVEGATNGKPSRVERIRAEDLQRRGVTDLAQALEWLAGGSPVSPTGTGQGLIVDGLPAGQLTVLRDGVPLDRAAGSQSGPIVDLSSIVLDPSTIERIDIYRGIGPAGSGRAGGVVVDIVTRQGPAIPSTFARAQLTGGRDPVFRQDYALGGEVPVTTTLGARIFVQGMMLDAIDVDQDETPDTPGQERAHVETSWTWRPSTNSFLRTDVLGTTGRTTSFGGPAAQLDDAVTRRALRTRVHGRWWAGEDVRVDHQTQVAVEDRRFDKLVRASGFARNNNVTRQVGARQTGMLTAFLGAHDLSVELLGDVQRVDRETLLTEPGQTALVAPFTATLATFVAGATDTWYVGRSVEIFGRALADVSNPFGPGASGQLGAAFGVGGNVKLRTSASQTRRVPTAEELFLDFDHSEVGYRVQGNTALRPEVLRSVRFGAVWTSSDKTMGLEAEAFAHRITDAITEIPVDVPPGQAALFTYDNLALTQTAGVNATAQFRALPAGLSLLANYAFLPVARDVDAGQRLLLRPMHSGRAELRGHWFDRRLSAWTDVSMRSGTDVPTSARYDNPGVAVVGLGASYTLHSATRVLLDVNNLLDQKNAEWGPTPGFHAFLMLQLGWSKGS
ncbi:MAG: TonB-dependent receptor [Myxococcota bacterium]